MSERTTKPSSSAKQAGLSPRASDKTKQATPLAAVVGQESEVHYKAVLAAMPDLMFGYSRQGVILYHNAPDKEELYLGPEVFIGKKIDEVLPRSVGTKYRNFIQRTLETGQLQHFEYQLLVPKGLEDFEARMVVSGPDEVLAIVRNITERKQSENALLESEKRFKAIADNAGDCIFVKDMDRRYTFVNPATQQLMGLPEADILGKTPKDIFPPEQAQIVKELDDRTFSGETVDETRILAIGGKEFFLHSLQTPLTTADGEVTSIMGIVRDATERKRALKRELHDGVSQQLAGLRLLLASLRRDLSATHPEAADRTARIEQVVCEALTSVRQITEGLERLSEEPDALVEALRKLAYRTTDLFRIHCRFLSRKPVLIQNPDAATHLFLIAQEAVTNAIKHANPGSISISLTERNGTVRLTVKDDGVGFSHKKQSPGMGISIMRNRATLIGASFDVQAGKTGGTIVTCSWKPPLAAPRIPS